MREFKRLMHLYGLYFSRVLNYPLVKPNTVTLTLTSRCNLRCIMCDHWRSKGDDELTLSQWKSIIDQIARWGIKEVDLSGGEPFMRKDLSEIIAYLTRKKIGINITTNFTLPTRAQIESLFSSSVTRLQISLDGIGNLHDEIRGMDGAYKKIIGNVEHFNSLKQKMRSSIQLNATTVIMSKNLSCLHEIRETTKGLGFSSITYQPVVDSNLDIKRRDRINPLKVQPDQMAQMEEALDSIIALRQKGRYIGNSIKHLSNIKRYFRGEKLPDVVCYAGFLVGIISPNGHMWSCMGDFADLKKQLLVQAWFSKKAGQKRRAIMRCRSPCLYPCYLETDADGLVSATANVLRGKA